MPRRHRDDCTSDSELADSNEDPFERETDADFDYTTPESGCDNKEPSQSRYRNSMAMQAADQSNDDQSERDEDEECSMREMFSGDAYDRVVNSKNRGSQHQW